ncbi:hypothetical protein LCGC14_0786260 [marine sediment metagenome]|uniref:N-formylglutamate amidohydrolase n=1 Tax=marine sediment metagenome TaxID=412755 RepID=A0A0F9PY82_9ZZZZ
MLEILPFKQMKFIKVFLGSKNIRTHIDAVHAHPPNNDKFTCEIAEKISEDVNCSCIIATISRNECDLNRERTKKNSKGIDEYRTVIQLIQKHINNLNSNGKSIRPYLHLAIHGMVDDYARDIEIGTLHNQTCSVNIEDWFLESIRNFYENVTINSIFPGNSSKINHRKGCFILGSNYPGFGSNFNTIQIEISRKIREFQREELISNLSSLIKEFNRIF